MIYEATAIQGIKKLIGSYDMDSKTCILSCCPTIIIHTRTRAHTWSGVVSSCPVRGSLKPHGSAAALSHAASVTPKIKLPDSRRELILQRQKHVCRRTSDHYHRYRSLNWSKLTFETVIGCRMRRRMVVVFSEVAELPRLETSRVKTPVVVAWWSLKSHDARLDLESSPEEEIEKLTDRACASSARHT